MSELASHAAFSPEQLAQDIDWEFRDIANHLPLEVKMASAGIPVTLHEVPGIGTLSSTFLGVQTFRFRLSMESEHGVYIAKEFQEVYGLRLFDLTDTTPEDVQACPYPLDVVGQLLHTLHAGYIATQETPDVLRLVDKMRAEGMRLPGIEFM